MTKRIIRAMSNPHVTFLAHPTGRLLLKRDAYAVDIPAIIEAAAETGTWIEINAAPKRLDLDWRWWPLAKEKGVKCVINPDAHGVEKLPGIMVRRRRRAQRLAHEKRRDELPAVRQNRARAAAKALSFVILSRGQGPRSCHSRFLAVMSFIQVSVRPPTPAAA